MWGKAKTIQACFSLLNCFYIGLISTKSLKYKAEWVQIHSQFVYFLQTYLQKCKQLQAIQNKPILKSYLKSVSDNILHMAYEAVTT